MTALATQPPNLISSFKDLLRQKRYVSQQQLAQAMSEQGFSKLNQSKISRLLVKVGAERVRNGNNQLVYGLTSKVAIAHIKHTISSVLISAKDNGYQIVLTTTKGGGCIVAKMVESLGEQYGILGCVADDCTVIVVPTSIDNITQIKRDIVNYIDGQI